MRLAGGDQLRRAELNERQVDARARSKSRCRAGASRAITSRIGKRAAPSAISSPSPARAPAAARDPPRRRGGSRSARCSGSPTAPSTRARSRHAAERRIDRVRSPAGASRSPPSRTARRPTRSASRPGSRVEARELNRLERTPELTTKIAAEEGLRARVQLADTESWNACSATKPMKPSARLVRRTARSADRYAARAAESHHRHAVGCSHCYGGVALSTGVRPARRTRRGAARRQPLAVRDEHQRGAAAARLSSKIRSSTAASVRSSRLPLGSSASRCRLDHQRPPRDALALAAREPNCRLSTRAASPTCSSAARARGSASAGAAQLERQAHVRGALSRPSDEALETHAERARAQRHQRLLQSWRGSWPSSAPRACATARRAPRSTRAASTCAAARFADDRDGLACPTSRSTPRSTSRRPGGVKCLWTSRALSTSGSPVSRQRQQHVVTFCTTRS